MYEKSNMKRNIYKVIIVTAIIEILFLLITIIFVDRVLLQQYALVSARFELSYSALRIKTIPWILSAIPIFQILYILIIRNKLVKRAFPLIIILLLSIIPFWYCIQVFTQTVLAPLTNMPESINYPITLDMHKLQEYTNKKYSYRVLYPDTYYMEIPNAAYGHTTFSDSCFDVYVAPHNFSDIKLWQVFPLSSTMIKELASLPLGESKSYTCGEGPKITCTYTRLPNKNISNIDWFSFGEQNTFENHGAHAIYFADKDDRYYILSKISGAICPSYEIFPIFEFTK